MHATYHKLPQLCLPINQFRPCDFDQFKHDISFSFLFQNTDNQHFFPDGEEEWLQFTRTVAMMLSRETRW